MMTWLKSTALLPLLLILMTAVISGCSHNPTINEATNRLEINKQQIVIGTYVDQMTNLTDSMSAIPVQLDIDNNPPPTPVQTDLDAFLKENDCTVVPTDQKDGCYVRTRLVLIKMARRIDYLSTNNYVAKDTIKHLQTNVKSIITGLQDLKTGAALAK